MCMWVYVCLFIFTLSLPVCHHPFMSNLYLPVYLSLSISVYSISGSVSTASVHVCLYFSILGAGYGFPEHLPPLLTCLESPPPLISPAILPFRGFLPTSSSSGFIFPCWVSPWSFPLLVSLSLALSLLFTSLLHFTPYFIHSNLFSFIPFPHFLPLLPFHSSLSSSLATCS